MGESGIKDFFGDIRKHLMSGVSFMLPVIIVYALFMVLGQSGGNFGNFAVIISDYAYMMIVPVLAAYISFSIAGKMALIPALVVALMADQMGMGFIGGLIVGILTGYLIKLLLIALQRMKGGHTLDLLATFIFGPLLGTLFMGVVVYFLLAEPVSAFTAFLEDWLSDLHGRSAIILSIVLGAFIAFDMGGPINKIAYSFFIMANSQGAYNVVGPGLVAITVPPLALGISSLLSKRKYSEEERLAGKTALVFSAFGLTEGAIPFAVVDPFRVIPSIMVGSIVGAVCGTLFGIANTSIAPSIIGIFIGMVGTYGIVDILLFILAHIIGAAVTIVLLHFWKKDVPAEA